MPVMQALHWLTSTDGTTAVGKPRVSEYPYFCDRNDPGSAVMARRSDYWIPNPDGSFYGERTLITEGAGCPGKGPGTSWLPISLTPADPPPPPPR